MRVVAGKARRILLTTPKSDLTRPTTDRIKETLFNILAPTLWDCRFLDLFAGSGGIGIEALSRGAAHACFVDSSREALACIRDNLKRTRLSEQAQVYGMDVFSALRQMQAEKRCFDVVFLDPPYGKGLEQEVFAALSDSPLVHADTLFVTETALGASIPDLSEMGYEVQRIKTYKTNQHIFVTRK